ncbi:MAG: uracil phosphoribosyltransferase [Clostridia bacterium]
MENVFIMNHPLISHKLAILRDKNTTSKQFRELVSEIGMLICYEATRDLPLTPVKVETPLMEAEFGMIKSFKPLLVPILRAGLGMVEGVMEFLPNAAVGHIGLARNHETLEPELYYYNMPADAGERTVMILDPMLATGGSCSAAIKLVKERTGAKKIKLMSIVGAPVGVERISREHPDVQIYLGVMDEKLNDKGYILPGLGDAGDRLFDTF